MARYKGLFYIHYIRLFLFALNCVVQKPRPYVHSSSTFLSYTIYCSCNGYSWNTM